MVYTGDAVDSSKGVSDLIGRMVARSNPHTVFHSLISGDVNLHLP